LPDPGYPDYPSGVALAAAQLVPLPLEAPAWAPDFEAAPRGMWPPAADRVPARGRARRGLRLAGARWARLSLAVSDETLELGLERLERALS
jgi:hypothetical protein